MSRLIVVVTLSVFLAIAFAYSCGQSDRKSGYTATSEKQFVGDQACASCHQSEALAWKGSDHERAMDVADSTSVRGDFSNVTFTQKGQTFRFFKKDGRYMVEAPGPDGKERSYEITYTFGWTPLQQYLVDYGKGKLQALTVAWDTQKKQWFSLNSDENPAPGDWLHWTGGAMNWNTMCADCHSTQLKQNYQAETDSFHTTWTSINVSCESCHGPGRQHAEFMKTDAGKEASIERIRKDLKLTKGISQSALINKCARCHSLREKLVDGYKHSEKFLDDYNPTIPHPDMYFADGQIKGEDYVYGSFLQSKMFQNGVKCLDCHDPHSLELKANVTDNSLCLQCHESSYNSQSHYFHEPNTEASQCVNCHMPGRYYMGVDFRRDHSFRVPRPDLSVKYGTPNACNSCHDDKSAEWAAKAIEKRYGPDRPHHFSETLTKADAVGEQAIPDLKRLASDTTQPGIARAMAVWYVGQFPSREGVKILKTTLHDPDPLVRKSTAKALSNLPQNLKMPVLQEALEDSVGSVRIAAIGGLAEFSAADISARYKDAFNESMKEYRQYLDLNQYFPQGQMNRGQFFEKQGQIDSAIMAYQSAIQKDSLFNPARMNLAYLYNSRGDNAKAKRLLKTVTNQEPSFGPAYYSLALLLSEDKQLDESIPMFAKAAELMPENTRVYYNWAIALQTLQRWDQAEKVYLEVIDLAPENPEYRYGICTLYLQQQKPGKALPHAQKLVRLLPNNQQAKALLQRIQMSK